MAQIIANNQHTVHLKQSHLFGRLGNAVDTFLADATISRIHFLVEYHQPYWYLTDFSRNGTYLNGERIMKGNQVKLTEGDVISAGADHVISFALEDMTPPADILCHRNNSMSPILETLQLEKINHLPNQQHCELSIRRERNNWLLEEHQQQRRLRDGDWLTFDAKKWQIVLSEIGHSTLDVQQNALTLQDIQLQLSTSLDEETTSAKLISHMGEADLQVRSHHYLLLLLARKTLQDQQQGFDKTEQGWIYMDELIAMLGMPETLINIQIHRARKQLQTALEDQIDGKQLVERRSGQVRIGFDKVAIRKGDQAEYSQLMSA